MYSIAADMHTHSIASGHGIDTIRTLCEFGVKRGLEGIAITDHGPGLPGGAGYFHFWSLRRMVGGLDLPIRIFTGIEDEIVSKNGDLSLRPDIRKDLDIVMTGLHPDTWIAEQNLTVRTDAVIETMIRGSIHLFTHPVSTYLDVEIDRVLEAAAEHSIALELNASKLDQREELIRYLEQCAARKIGIMVNSDAHLGEEVGVFQGALALLKEIDFPQTLVLNRNRESVTSYLGVEW